MKSIVRIFLSTLENAGLLSFIVTMLMFGLIFLADGLLLLLLSTRTGGFMALGGSALISLLGVLLVGSSFKRYGRFAVKRIHTGNYPKEEFIHLSSLFISLIAVAIPGLFSSSIGLLLYIPFIRKIIGRGIHWKFNSEFREVYNYRRMIDE